MNRRWIARTGALPLALQAVICSAAAGGAVASGDALDPHQALQFLIGRQP